MAPPTTIAGGSSGNLHACIDDSRSLGQHLASRLLQIGCDTVFGVPGDYNLIRELVGERVGAAKRWAKIRSLIRSTIPLPFHLP